jgi:hypothetical protein
MSERGAIPETIEVELPAPFSGRALDSPSPDSTSSWTGNLDVRMPAIGMIPLTDSGFSAVFLPQFRYRQGRRLRLPLRS